MKRDWSVPVSLIAFLVALGLMNSLEMWQAGSTRIAVEAGLNVVMLLALLRAAVLWFQTLIHSLRYGREENRVIITLAHIFFGALMSYMYYFCCTTRPVVVEEAPVTPRQTGMKRDWSVPLSLIAYFVALTLLHSLEIWRAGSPRVAVEMGMKVVMWLALLRAIVLWFQTLIDSIRYAREENRVAAVLAHLVLGALISYAYYFCCPPQPVVDEEATGE